MIPPDRIGYLLDDDEDNENKDTYVGDIRPIYEAVCNNNKCGYINKVHPTHVKFICRQCGKEQEK